VVLERIMAALEGHRVVRLVGLQGSAGAFVLSRLEGRLPGPLVILAQDESRAEAMARDLRFFLPPDREIAVFPSWELLPFDQSSPYIRLQCRRLEILRRFLAGAPPRILVTSLEAWLTRLPPRQWLQAQGEFVGPGTEMPQERLVSFLQGSGYQRVALVEEVGDYSLRGGIVDCFPPETAEPVRLDFAGDRIESVRSFSPETQRSTGRRDWVEISPVREIPWSSEARAQALGRLEDRVRQHAHRGVTPLLEAMAEGIPFPGMEFLLPRFHRNLEGLPDYLPPETILVLDDPDRLEAGWTAWWERAQERAQSENLPLARLVSPQEIYLPPGEVRETLEGRRTLSLHGIRIQRPGEDPSRVVPVPCASQEGLRAELSRGPWDGAALERLGRRLGQWLDEGVAVHWALRSRRQVERMGEHLRGSGLPCGSEEPPVDWRGSRPRVWLHTGELSQGFVSQALGVSVLDEQEVFGLQRLRRPGRTARKLPSITHLEDLQDGDLVVHVDHGIGVYRGMSTLEAGGIRGDFLLLEYLGRDRLYVPVDRFGSVHRYVGSEGVLPRIDRLGGGGWETRKGKVRRAVERMAKELLQLYASREVTSGHAFSPPGELYGEFAEAFAHEETPDQHRAIQEVMEDMGEPRPMDRLVCGDVGFGKTEVAMRAAFRAAMDGKQVAYLVPTTLLAQQHYRTFMERFRGYPIFVEVLSRFRAPREQREIIERCGRGEVDILIGTHRLLQKDLAFKDLGLLILDEEHRFGVSQKERLKRMRREVDVLTLTATPIPRTLHMAMVGIRDLSIIETPPPGRRSIKTFLAPFHRDLVREAVQREMSRGGQIFFVHNRVQGMEGIAATLREWLPEVRMGVAHGQMGEKELSRVMERFHGRELDLLLCTTIIEAGLDIPTANTILIHDAHKLGLAEMYQIRGRVGRSGHQAYAYLLLPGPPTELTPEALRRLETLQEFSELGAGFRIATRDLEIRGAGTLLGPSQSGHIEAVGFEMYTQLMQRAIAELKGEPLPPQVEPEIQLPIHAYIPEAYVPDAHQRLALYRRLAAAEPEGDLEALRDEMRDRFGPLPEEGENLFHVMELKALLRALGIRLLAVIDGRLRVAFHPTTPVAPRRLVEIVHDQGEGGGMRFVSEDTVEIPLDAGMGQPLPVLAKNRLKGLFLDASMVS
jgi:transcription-repair coupling factor (superfamily II helicase)